MIELIAKFKERFPTERFSVGLNLSPKTIKLIKLRYFKDKLELCGYYMEQNQQDLEGALKKLIMDFGVKSVNISVSGQQAIVRYVDFPRMNKEELKQAIKFEAQKYIPFPVNEVTLDGAILRNDLPDNKMRVLLAAVKKDFLGQQMKFLESLGIEINTVEVDSVSLMNAFNFNYKDDELVVDKTVALLNIGQTTSNLNILESGVPALSRDIPIGRDTFIQKIADVLAVDFKAVESGSVSLDKAGVVVELVISKLAEEIRTSFDYYESRSVSTVERIFLTGEANLYQGNKEKLADFLAIKVINWDPLKKLIIADNLDVEKLRGFAGELAIAIGLALRG